MFPPILPRPTKPICTGAPSSRGRAQATGKRRRGLLLAAVALAGCGLTPEERAREVVARLCREVPARLARIEPPRTLTDMRRVGRDGGAVLRPALRELELLQAPAATSALVDETEYAVRNAVNDFDDLETATDDDYVGLVREVVRSLGRQAVRLRSTTGLLGAPGCMGSDNRFLDPLREPVYEVQVPTVRTSLEAEELEEPLSVAGEHRRWVVALRSRDRRRIRAARAAVLSALRAARVARAR